MTAQDDKAVTAFLSRIGSKGGKASAAKLTPEERQERARKAAQIRWKDKKEEGKP